MSLSLDLVVRARRTAVGGTLRPCSVGVSAGRIAAVEPFDAALDAADVVDLAPDEVLLPGLVETTCTSTSLAAPNGRASRP